MIGVFGGSGFYRFLDEVEEVAVDTPYGPPSARDPDRASGGAKVAFMPRHGDEHSLPPHRINYRANVWAMREVGVRRIIGPSACGSLKPELRPGTFVVCDQFVDRTQRARGHLLRRAADHARVRRATPTAADLRRRPWSTAASEERDRGRGRRDGGGDPGPALLHAGRVALVRRERLGRGQHDPVPRVLARPRAGALLRERLAGHRLRRRVWRACRTSSRSPRTPPSRFSAENLDRLRALLFQAVPKIGPQPDDACATALSTARSFHQPSAARAARRLTHTEDIPLGFPD